MLARKRPTRRFPTTYSLWRLLKSQGSKQHTYIVLIEAAAHMRRGRCREAAKHAAFFQGRRTQCGNWKNFYVNCALFGVLFWSSLLRCHWSDCTQSKILCFWDQVLESGNLSWKMIDLKWQKRYGFYRNLRIFLWVIFLHCAMVSQGRRNKIRCIK